MLQPAATVVAIASAVVLASLTNQEDTVKDLEENELVAVFKGKDAKDGGDLP